MLLLLAGSPAQLLGLGGSSNAGATGSLSLTGPPGLLFPNSGGGGNSQAIATGSLTLYTPSAVGSRAAPGWLGLFVTDNTAASIPLITGGSNAAASGSLSLLVPSPRLISGSSTATAGASLTFVVGALGGHLNIDTEGYFSAFGSSGEFYGFNTSGDFLGVVDLPA